MKIKSEKTSSSKGNVVILNDTSLPKRSTSSSPNKKDVRVVSIKNNNNVDSKKQDHYLMRSVKNERSELSESDSIAFVLAEEEDGNVVIQDLENAEAAAVDEELHLSGDDQEHDEEDDDNADVKEIVEHVCGKCFKTFRRIKGLKKHLDFCRIDSGYHIRKAEMLKNLDKIEKDAVTMENKDICFCCGESYDTFHLGHINCPDCPKSFKSQFSYERHIFITHSENNDYPCSICNAKLRSRKLLELHEDQHKNRGKPFACKVCGREFTRPYHLKRHQKYSTCSTDNSTAVSCNVCDKVFYRLDNLRAHLKQHLGTQVNKKPEYTCPVCKNCFYSLSTLNIHTRTHTGERPFECDLCDKKFPVLVALKKHRRYHTGEKPYTCSVCNQCFAVKEVLNRHMKRHTGEKPHKCDECGKCFIQATQLRNHSKTHFRPFSCDVCSETFKTNKSLERHMRVHSARRRTVKQELNSTNENGNTSEVNENATAAENGGEETPTTAATKVVKRKPRVKKRTDCAVCDKNFKDVRSLQFHILKVHEVDPDDFVNEKPKTAMKTSPTKRGREQASKKGAEKANEGPSAKICKVEKSNNQTLVFSSNEDGTIGTIDDDGPVITNVKTICSGLVTVSDNITTTDTDGGLVVKEYIVDELPSSTENGETIIYHNDSYTVIPIDTYTTIDTTPVKETKAKPASKTVSGSGGSTTSATRSAKEKQRSSLGASLAAAIADIPDMEVDEDIDDEEEQDDDEKPTEEDIKLKNNVNKLLDMLVDAETLKKFGWPNASEEETLCKVIENCGHDTSKDAQCYKELDFGSRMREYVKLLFTVVIPNESIKELLNNYPIDEVIEFVLGNEEDDEDVDDFEEVDRKPATMENKKESASLLKA